MLVVLVLGGLDGIRRILKRRVSDRWHSHRVGGVQGMTKLMVSFFVAIRKSEKRKDLKGCKKNQNGQPLKSRPYNLQIRRRDCFAAGRERAIEAGEKKTRVKGTRLSGKRTHSLLEGGLAS